MWLALALGMTAAMALVVWFIIQSIYVIGVLCPWCMLTWVVTIPLFVLVVCHVLRSGAVPVPVPMRVRSAAAAAYSWVFIITITIVLLIVVLAQLRLDVLSHL
ncbi:MAG: vitamin K epoxide reductase family protein [Lacisediminihabitans sp.]